MRALINKKIGWLFGLFVFLFLFVVLADRASADDTTVSVQICPSTGCEQIVPKPGPGPLDTRGAITVDGFGAPGSIVYILQDGAVARTDGISLTGTFSAALTGLSPGQTTIGVYAVDQDGLITPTESVTVVVYEHQTTRIYNLLLPPTIKVDRDQVKQGERVLISGRAYPSAKILVLRSPDRQSQQVLADRRGKYEAIFDTSSLIGSYGVTALARLDSGVISEASQSVSFTVIPFAGQKPLPPLPPGQAPPPRPEGPVPSNIDLNGDRKVDLSDFSIMLYNWGVPKDPKEDFNHDGVVDLIDLSILLYWWTG